MTATTLERFERLYQASPDPWGYRTSSYEQEKYAATLAAIPQQRAGLCLEVGCSIGVFTGLLAARCEHAVAIDFSLSALELARQNLRGVRNVDLLRAGFPEETPAGSWDLVVCSEVLYYLQPPALEEAIGWIRAQLGHGTSVIAVSWRGAGRDEPLLGDEVHDRLARELVDKALGDADPDSYDALVLPGGVANPDQLRTDGRAIEFVQAIFSSGKPVGVICHGSWTLVEADLVRHRKLTSWPSLQTDIRNAGGEWVDEEVVVDQGLVSSRKPDDLPAFCAKIVEEFAEGRHEVAHAGATEAGS